MTSYGRQRAPGKTDPAALGLAPFPASTVALWVADDCSAVGDGNAVSSWVDRIAGLSASNTSTARPLYRATGLGGKRPSVQFDGTNDVLTVTASNPVSVSSTGTIIAVADVTTPVSGGCSMWGSGDDGSSTRYILGPIIAGPKLVAQADTGGGSADIMAGNVTAGVPSIYEWEAVGVESLKPLWRLRQNNSILTLTAQANSNNGRWFAAVTSRDRFGIGGLPFNNTVNNFLNGHVALLVVIDAELTPAQRVAIYQWLAAQYGIAVAGT